MEKKFDKLLAKLTKKKEESNKMRQKMSQLIDMTEMQRTLMNTMSNFMP